MKYCPNCGNQLKDNARFCGKCGNAVRELKPAGTPVIEETEKPVIKPQKQKKKNRHLPFILALAVLAAGITGGLFGFGVIQKKASTGKIYYKELEPEHVKGEGSIAYVDNEILLTAAEGTGKKDIENLIKPYSGKIVGYIEVTGDYQIEFEEIRTIEALNELAEVLKNDPAVKRASVNYVNEVSSSAILKDESAAEEWVRSEQGAWGWEAIHAPEAWEYLKDPNTKAVNVGVLEGYMFYDDHPAIKDTYEEKTFDNNSDNSHGSAVASVIAGEYVSEDGMYGVYPLGREANGKKHMYFGSIQTTSVEKARQDMAGLMSYKAEIAALAMRDCKVINASFCSSIKTAYLFRETDPEYASAVVEYRKNEAAEMGEFLRDLFEVKDFLYIQAAGNDSNGYYMTVKANDDGAGNIVSFDYDPTSRIICPSNENGTSIDYNDNTYNISGGDSSKVLCLNGQLPIEYSSVLGALRWFGTEYQDVLDHVIFTGAIGKDFNNDSYYVSAFSNEGELYMPGETIRGAKNTGDNNNPVAGYEYWNGTSLAAPMMTGTAALVWSQNEHLKAASVKTILQNSLIQYDNITMVDAEKAVKRSSMYAQVPDDSGRGKGILAGVFVVYEEDYYLDGYLNIKDLNSGETTKYLVKGDKDFYLVLEEGDYQLISAGDNTNEYGEITFENDIFHMSEDDIIYAKILMYEKFQNGTLVKRAEHYDYEGKYDKAKHTKENCQYYTDATYEDTYINGLLMTEKITGDLGDFGGWYPPYIYQYQYDSAGNILRLEKYAGDESDNILFETEDYQYDSHGNITYKKSSYFDPYYGPMADVEPYGEWTESEAVYEYVYNPDGTMASEESYEIYEGKRRFMDSFKYTYDSTGKLVSAVWNDYYPTYHTYDSNGVLVHSSTPLAEVDYIFDDLGRMISSINADVHYPEPEITNIYYDSFDRLTEQRTQTNYGNGWYTKVDIYSYSTQEN